MQTKALRTPRGPLHTPEQHEHSNTLDAATCIQGEGNCGYVFCIWGHLGIYAGRPAQMCAVWDVDGSRGVYRDL